MLDVEHSATTGGAVDAFNLKRVLVLYHSASNARSDSAKLAQPLFHKPSTQVSVL